MDNFTAGAQLPTKTCWKQIINKSVRNHEKKQRLAMLYGKDKDFVRFQRVHTSQNLYHIWNLNLNLNSLLVTRQMTLLHQGVRMWERLVP